MDKVKMIGKMVDQFEQFVLSERILLELIDLGDRYAEAEKKWKQEKGAEVIPFKWGPLTFDLAHEGDRAEIRYGEYNLLQNLSKEECFDVFCVMEIGRWIDYKRGFDMDAVSDFINWADEWYVQGKHTHFEPAYLAGKTKLSQWLRSGWDIIGPEYKRRRQLGIEKATDLTKLEEYPHIIAHVANCDEGIVLTLEYRGVTGTVEFSTKDYMYFGRVGSRLYEGRDLPELIDSFRGEVDRHFSGEAEIISYADLDNF